MHVAAGVELAEAPGFVAPVGAGGALRGLVRGVHVGRAVGHVLAILLLLRLI